MSRIEKFIADSNKSGEVIELLIRRFYGSLPARRTFIDGGANVGYHTNHARRTFSGPVVAVEASPRTFVNLIAAQIALKHAGPLAPVIPVCAALGHRDVQGATVQFHHSPTHPGRSTVNRELWDDWSKSQVAFDAPIEVAVIEIDEIKALYAGDQTVDFIKLDLEGNEIHALRGASHTLKTDRPSIVMEFGMRPKYEHIYKETCEGYLGLMAKFGYSLYTPWAERAEASILQGYPFNYVFALPNSAYLPQIEQLLVRAFEDYEP